MQRWKFGLVSVLGKGGGPSSGGAQRCLANGGHNSSGEKRLTKDPRLRFKRTNKRAIWSGADRNIGELVQNMAGVMRGWFRRRAV